MVLGSVDYSGNANCSNPHDEYSDIFEYIKGITPQYYIEHHIDLLDPYKSPPKSL